MESGKGESHEIDAEAQVASLRDWVGVGGTQGELLWDTLDCGAGTHLVREGWSGHGPSVHQNSWEAVLNVYVI